MSSHPALLLPRTRGTAEAGGRRGWAPWQQPWDSSRPPASWGVRKIHPPGLSLDSVLCSQTQPKGHVTLAMTRKALLPRNQPQGARVKTLSPSGVWLPAESSTLGSPGHQSPRSAPTTWTNHLPPSAAPGWSISTASFPPLEPVAPPENTPARYIYAHIHAYIYCIKLLVAIFPMFFIFLRFYLFLERGSEGGKHQCVVASGTPLTGDLDHNPGMCPDWESNQQPFGLQSKLQTSTQSTESHQPGTHIFV